MAFIIISPARLLDNLTKSSNLFIFGKCNLVKAIDFLSIKNACAAVWGKPMWMSACLVAALSSVVIVWYQKGEKVQKVCNFVSTFWQKHTR
jgi:hypothetical protein